MIKWAYILAQDKYGSGRQTLTGPADVRSISVKQIERDDALSEGHDLL